MTHEFPDLPDYLVEAEIGRGGMGVVYRVRRRSDQAVFALKMLLGGRGEVFGELLRFRIEVEALACLDHPNIVKVRDVGLYGGYLFFAMDYAERGSLKDFVAQGLPNPTRSAELVLTISRAVQHAHARGMLHRDLKPAKASAVI